MDEQYKGFDFNNNRLSESIQFLFLICIINYWFIIKYSFMSLACIDIHSLQLFVLLFSLGVQNVLQTKKFLKDVNNIRFINGM